MTGNFLQRGSTNKTVIYLFLLMAVLATSVGCESVRKKFVRKKKAGEEQSNFIPVLEPIDYAPQQVSVLERYKSHYSLWQIWVKDLDQQMNSSFDRDRNDKQLKFLLAQIITQLEEMKKSLIDEKQKQLAGLIDDLGKVQMELDKPEQFRNNYLLKTTLSRNEKVIRNNFKPRVIEKDLIKP